MCCLAADALGGLLLDLGDGGTAGGAGSGLLGLLLLLGGLGLGDGGLAGSLADLGLGGALGEDGGKVGTDDTTLKRELGPTLLIKKSCYLLT